MTFSGWWNSDDCLIAGQCVDGSILNSTIAYSGTEVSWTAYADNKVDTQKNHSQ
jgi:hypothetical protein